MSHVYLRLAGFLFLLLPVLGSFWGSWMQRHGFSSFTEAERRAMRKHKYMSGKP